MTTITFNIPDDKLVDFKAGFLKSSPVPLDENENPLFTEEEWIKEAARRWYISQYENGKRLLAFEQNYTTDISVIT